MTDDLRWYRSQGRELLARSAAAEADRSLFDRDSLTMAKLYGGMEYVLGRLLDELDAREAKGDRR